MAHLQTTVEAKRTYTSTHYCLRCVRRRRTCRTCTAVYERLPAGPAARARTEFDRKPEYAYSRVTPTIYNALRSVTLRSVTLDVDAESRVRRARDRDRD